MQLSPIWLLAERHSLCPGGCRAPKILRRKASQWKNRQMYCVRVMVETPMLK